ncbi:MULTISPECIES: beta-N-acetylhexosaminidase [unclassified Microbacterium]|uniref:beta-N-acetylhexosaminidase n=1 Tax=unclassified Microbacterium TaxID=2609290 RepID=UPI00214A972C|nr:MULTISPECIES: beta-N-acetylhexosaminidase [unclassified Microbacterium]MCR2810476.1 beta-N-acetylhexosaminidase [Microbacterium sp. zg.B185]WIM18527.1 beta-N-acetylhexosaminidase [Microbacterium sp. zg-B185]
MSAPAPSFGVVPAPLSIAADATAAPFRIDGRVRILGDADAAAALTAILTARTGVTVDAPTPSAAESAASAPESASSAPESAPPAPDSASTPRASGPAVELRIEPGAPAESYRLTAEAASVMVTGADAAGLFYGVQTLGQLIVRDRSGFAVPAVRIADRPRFGYRGVMLDVARHFFGVETVKAYIDRAAALKFNALHLHLTDDQGWRIHLDSRPRLTEFAAGTAVGGDVGGFYSTADYREIVRYAASRHMIVVPEVDLPGHTHAVGLAYPDLVEPPDPDHPPGHEDAPPPAAVPYTGTDVGFSSLKIRDEATYDFVADVVGELAAMTPGPYLHIGGDEALRTDPGDFGLFMARATGIVADLGKIPVTWHEAGAAGGIDPSTVGQYWGFTTPADGMADAARAFARDAAGVILSPADAVYLDMKDDPASPLGLIWANGPTSVERAYSWEPTSIIAGVGEDDIVGVEAPMWTETIRTLEDIDRMAFPRIAAAAEVAWSAQNGELRTWESFRSRVGTLGPLWTSLGIRFHPSGEIPWSTD